MANELQQQSEDEDKTTMKCIRCRRQGSKEESVHLSCHHFVCWKCIAKSDWQSCPHCHKTTSLYERGTMDNVFSCRHPICCASFSTMDRRERHERRFGNHPELNSRRESHGRAPDCEREGDDDRGNTDRNRDYEESRRQNRDRDRDTDRDRRRDSRDDNRHRRQDENFNRQHDQDRHETSRTKRSRDYDQDTDSRRTKNRRINNVPDRSGALVQNTSLPPNASMVANSDVFPYLSVTKATDNFY